jgi:hypothetical protein
VDIDYCCAPPTRQALFFFSFSVAQRCFERKSENQVILIGGYHSHCRLFEGDCVIVAVCTTMDVGAHVFLFVGLRNIRFLQTTEKIAFCCRISCYYCRRSIISLSHQHRNCLVFMCFLKECGILWFCWVHFVFCGELFVLPVGGDRDPRSYFP